MKLLLHFYLILSALLFAATFSTNAQLIQSFSGGDPLSLGPGTAGFEFQVGSQPITLSAFGVFDEFSDGVLNDAHAVGLWNANTGTLLAKVTVAPSSATLSGGTFWQNLLVPITLQQGGSYRIAAQYSDVDLDLARLYLTDDAPPNSESRAIACAVGYIRRHYQDVRCLVSYADPSAGHRGTIYKAAGWKQDGRTDQERKTPRFDYEANGVRYSRRSHVPEGATIKRVPRVSKFRFYLPL